MAKKKQKKKKKMPEQVQRPKDFQPPVRHFLLPGKSVFDRLFDRFRRKRNLAGNYPQHQCRDNRGRRVKPNFSVAFLTHIFTFRKKNIDKI